MKRWLRTMMSLVLVGAFAMTAVRPALAIDKPYLSGTTNSTLTNPPDDATELNWSGAYGPVNTGRNFYTSIYCDGANCYKVPIFIEATVSVNYSDVMGHGPYLLTWSYDGAGGATHTDSITCSTSDVRAPVRRTCAAHLNLLILGSEISSGTHAAHIGFNLSGNNEGALYSEVWMLDLTMSSEPINTTPCDDAYDDIGLSQGGEIDPTSETGSAVTNLDIGSDYRLTVTGGPWVSADAPTVSRYDTASKIDDGDWLEMELAQTSEDVICLQNSDDGHSFSMVFEVTDTDFAIRVADVVGQFADNSYSGDPITWEIIKVVAATEDTGCAGQFLQGNLLGTYVLDGNDSVGERITIPAPGKWVQVVVQAGTYWKDDGAGPNLLTVAIEPGKLPWFTLEAYPFSQCADVDTGNYYFQIANPGAHYLRVADTGSNWEDNTGSLTINVYSATYDPYPSECESHYKIGDVIETKVVSGNSSVGIEINDGQDSYPPLPVGGEREDVYRYLMMEIVNGPFWDGLAYSAATEVYYGPDATWHPSIVFPTATCISLLDGLGRTRIYFPYEQSIGRKQDGTWPTPWKFRPHDGDSSWGNNTGYIGYTLYQADLLNVDSCDQFYNPSIIGDPITVLGNDEVGSTLGSLDDGMIYALETSAGPWVDGGVSKYDVAFTLDDGDTWEPVQTSDLFICKAEDGNYITVYFQALEGADYRIRVNDDAGDFGNNSGWMHVTLYAITSLIDPWGSCADNYTLGDEMTVTAAERTVIAYQENGLQLPLEAGNTYAVEIGTDIWNEAGGIGGGGTAARLAQITDERSASGDPTSWEDFSDPHFAACVVQIPDEENANNDRYRIYFVALSVYNVRVDDQDGIWSNNTGNLDLHYYQLTTITNSGNREGLPASWSSACYEPCMRPQWFFKSITIDIGLGPFSFPIPAFDDWLEYSRCALQKYFAWCPEHTVYLQSLTNIVRADKDPFATIADLGDFYSFIKQQVESTSLVAGGESNWPLDGGGERNDGNIMDILTPGLDRGNNPWFGGQIDLASGYSRGGEYVTPMDITFCTMQSAMNKYWGEGVMIGVCQIIVTMKTSPIFAILITVTDMLLVIFMVFRYIPNTSKRLWNMVVKNKGYLRTVIS
jgi:hypothetical protein